MIAIAYKRLLQIGKVAGAITFLAGIPYGAYQYIEAKQDHRVAQSLEMFKQFNSSPISTYREHVLKAVSEYKQQMAEAAKDPKELEKLVIGMIAKKDIETDILLLMDFFDGVSACVVNNLCDADTTQKLFSARARELYLNFFQYIALHRSTIATVDFGLGLETIARTGQKQTKSP